MLSTTAKKPSKASPRRRAREFALQGLYGWALGAQDEAAVLAGVQTLEAFHRADTRFCLSLMNQVMAERERLSTLLCRHIDREFDSLSPVESSLLMMGTHELTDHPETPYRVIINEYIELAKAFGGIDGHKYINGVLDKIALDCRSAEIAREQVLRAEATVETVEN